MAGGVRATLGDQYLAQASSWELLAGTAVGATAGVLAGWAVVPAGATGMAAFGYAMLGGAAAGGADYLGTTLTASAINAYRGYGGSPGPTWSGLGIHVAGGAIGGGVFHLGSLGVGWAGGLARGAMSTVGRSAQQAFTRAESQFGRWMFGEFALAGGGTLSTAAAVAHVGTVGIARPFGANAFANAAGGVAGGQILYSVGRGSGGSAPRTSGGDIHHIMMSLIGLEPATDDRVGTGR